MHTAFLLTGSNTGNPLDNLRTAFDQIYHEAGKMALISSVYQTAPWGNVEQAAFLNQVLCIETILTPYVLMQTLLDIEKKMGRIRKNKWEPRVMDIDILFYDDMVIRESDLMIPHPLLHQRRFTLIPLCEIAPYYIHPELKKTMTQLLNDCTDMGSVEKL